MPVYHVSNFDVSAVQIDLSANIFQADTISADYWVKKLVDFNSGGAIIANNATLNNLFTNIAHTSFGDLGNAQVFRNSGGTRSNNYDNATTSVTGVKFKDLGIIKGLGGGDDSLFTSDIYTNISALTTNQIADETSFVGKVNARLQTIGATDITGLAEKMMATINVGSDPDLDLGTNQAVPAGSKFGFLVVRNLNLAGASQDRQTFIGVVLEQQS
jgi:hypothetical protein